MQSPTRTQVLTAAPLAIIGLVFMACAGGGSRDTTSPAPAVSTSAAAPAGPGATKETPAPIGTAVEPAKGWTVSVVSANVNADAEMAAVNQFNKPQAGSRFVLVQLGIRNNSDRAAAPMTSLKVSVLAGGVSHTMDFNQPPAPRLDVSASLQPGATMQGWLPFQVPAAATDVVLLAEPYVTLDQMDDQRFLALA